MTYEGALCAQRLKELGKELGFLTYEQVNLHIPSSIVDPDEIAAIVEQVERAGIRVLENHPDKG